MEDTDQATVLEGIRIFKERYGIKEPLDLFRFEEIITELKEAKKTKIKGNK